MDKFRITASERRSKATDDWLDNFRDASWKEFRRFVRSWVLPGPYLPGTQEKYPQFYEFLKMADEMEAKGIPPWKCPGLVNELREAMALGINALDTFSIIGAKLPPNDEGGRGTSVPWSMLAPMYYMEWAKGDGGYLTITGRPRSGKTNIACLMGEHWNTVWPNSQILTNIPLDGKCAFVRPVSRMSELLRGVADALENERRWLWELDEGGLVWLRADAMKTSSKGLERFARIVPKLGGSFAYIEQRIEGVPSVIQDFAQSHIYTDQVGFCYADLPAYRTSIRSIPRAKVFRYRTGETGYFEVDLNLDQFLSALPERGRKTQAQRINSFLDLVGKRKAQGHDPTSGKFLKKEPIKESS